MLLVPQTRMGCGPRATTGSLHASEGRSSWAWQYSWQYSSTYWGPCECSGKAVECSGTAVPGVSSTTRLGWEHSSTGLCRCCSTASPAYQWRTHTFRLELCVPLLSATAVSSRRALVRLCGAESRRAYGRQPCCLAYASLYCHHAVGVGCAVN
jgi:hypothetical protein